MNVPFLRGKEVDLCPMSPGDAALLDLMPWRLAPAEGGDVIALAVRAKAGALAGMVRVEGIDWVNRQAVVSLRARGPGEAEALRLATRYAFEELAMERLETRPRSEDETLVRACGFKRDAAGAWALEPR